MIQVQITQVHTGMANTKNGPKPKVAIKTKEHGDQWLSAFDDKGYIAQKAKEGWAGKIVVDQNNGFLNFRFPTKQDYLEERIERCEEKLGLSPMGPRPAGLTNPSTQNNFTTPGPFTIASQDNYQSKYPETEVNIDDIPF